MMERSPLTDGSLDACAKFGIGFTPYMPLASGFLSGAYKPGMKYSNDDIHRTSTWFTDENLRTAEIELTDADMKFIDTTLDGLTLYGDCKEDKVFALGDMLKEEGYVIEKSWKNK